jgi:hypothetical protein
MLLGFLASNYMFMEFFETAFGYVMLGGSLAEDFAEGCLCC